MNEAKGAPTMDDVMGFVTKFSGGHAASCSQAMFYFLYKEVLLNRIMLLEQDAQKNRGAIEHFEKIVNDLNIKIMDQLKGTSKNH